MKTRILGLGGSLADRSASLRALELALESAAANGAEVHLVEACKLELPYYDPTSSEIPAAARRIAELALNADGLIWSSPTYHGALSGALKNTLDWLQILADHDPPYLTDRPVGLIATAAGERAVQTINTMATSVQALRGWTLPFSVTIGAAYRAFAPDGTPRNPEVAAQLATLGSLVVDFAVRLGRRTGTDIAGTDTAGPSTAGAITTRMGTTALPDRQT